MPKSKIREGLNLAELQFPVFKQFMAAATLLTPLQFQVFVGSLMANVAGNLPDDYWAKVRTTCPCEVKGCDCHVNAEIMMAALEKLREDHKKFLEKEKN